MLVVHGVWADGALSLWAEHAPGSATGRGRAYRRAGAVRPHPFAAGSADLAAALGGLPGPVPDLVRKATEHELTLWLPSVPAGPQPSPEMEALAGQAAARGAAPGIPVPATELPATPVPATAAPERLAPEPPAARRTAPPRVRLAAWQVPALAFEPAAAAGLLGSLASPDVGAADVAVPVTASR